MQSVAVDHANPEPGEEAYVLQLRLPEASGADGGALMDKIGRFVSLYLTAAQPETARFAQMGGLTWVIAAPADAAWTLDQVRADLAQTLYGEDDGAQVRLEWPDGVAPAAPQEDEASELDEVSHAEDAFDIEATPEAFEADEEAWTVDATPAAGAETFSGSEDAPAIDPIANDLDVDAFELADSSTDMTDRPALEAEPVFEPDAADVDADDVFVIDEPADDLGDDVFDVDSDPAAVEDTALSDASTKPAASDEWEVATAAQRAAFDDSTDVFEVDALDIEIVDGPGLASDPETETPIDPLDVDLGAPLEIDGFDDLTEAPERPEPSDISAELSAFRAEMREIAASIPGAGGGDALADFRAELDAISGAMGQRVDGAAQRIEAAASQVVEATERLDAERLSAAADRAERSAAHLEAGVSDALGALNAAVKAMSGEASPRASDVAG